MDWSGIGEAVGAIAGALSGGMNGAVQSTAQTVSYGLAAGDLVCLLPIKDGQNYIVLGKLIYAGEAVRVEQ